jgi:CheY-like chemotaxis protein
MKILLVEDEADIREIYTELLSLEGYGVDQASDGDEALDKALNSAWDILLLDIMLPKRDGLEILSNIKSNENLRDKPVILLTNLDKDSILQSCMQLGANNYLVKSNITPQEVIKEVAKYNPEQESSDE